MTARPDLWRSSRLGVVVTGAVLAALVCLFWQPWPTLYALGTLASAVVLAAGIRRFVTERRAPAGPSRRHAPRQQLRDELAALHEGEQPYTDPALVPTPAQWIWRWNHATPAQRLEYAERALTNAERLTAIHHVVIRLGNPHDDLAVHVRAALLGEPLAAVHQATEQQASSMQQVDESAGGHAEVVHRTGGEA